MIRILLLVTTVALPTAAQRPSTLLQEARQAFLLLELDRARDLAARSIDRSDGDTLTTRDRTDAVMLLGTIAVLQDRAADAERRFRDLIVLAPLYVPDSLNTPSAPLQAFQRVREATKATVLEAPGPQLRVGPDRPFRATVRVSSRHDVVVAALTPGGDTLDVLWSGPVGGSETVSWVPPPGAVGSYVLVSGSRVDGRIVREVRVPMTLATQEPDTLPWPRAPILRPVGPVTTASPWRPLAIGAALGATVVLAPVVSGGETGSPGRFVVAAGLTAGGVFGFLRARRGAGNAEVAATNASARAAWERERRQVAAENARRRSSTPVDIRTGTPERLERAGGR